MNLVPQAGTAEISTGTPEQHPAASSRLLRMSLLIGYWKLVDRCLPLRVASGDSASYYRNVRSICAFMSDHRPFASHAAGLCLILLAISLGARAQNTASKKSPTMRDHKGGAASPRVSLSPRFVPGQTFRYEMEFETTTDTSRSGLASDPQGPSSLVVDWNATVRIEVLPADAGTPGRNPAADHV